MYVILSSGNVIPMRDKLIQIRCHDAERDVIQANAKKAGKKVGPFLRDLGLSNGGTGFGDSQAKAERVGTSVPSSAPVAEPRNQGSGPQLPDAGTYPPVYKEPPPIPREVQLETLITQLKGQGMTTRVATQEAKKRLGL